MKKVLQLTLVFVIIFTFNSESIAQLEYPGDVDILGPAEVIFSSLTDSCSSENIPDAPVRFFRDINNQIQVIISHFEGYRMIGPDFNSLTVDCANGPVWTSDFNADPSQYNNKEWLTGLYTHDGKTIYSLVHNEHEGSVLSNWYNSITLAVSSDTGKTYSHAAPPSHLVASIPYQYQAGMGPAGIFEPSNIIYHNGYYYVMLHTESYGLQETGASIMRTQDLSDPTSWEVWDGEGFNNTFINPYTETGYDPANHVAAILDYTKIEKMHSNITWNTYFNKFLLVGSAQKGGVWGFYYSLSDDLIHWTVRKLIMEVNVNINAQSGSDVYGYPAIVDHNDTTRNFEVTGQEVYLYYSKWPYGQNYNRTLERIPIRFNKLLVDGFVVTGRGDKEDTNPGNGIAITSAGKTSLRSAIEESNARPPWYKDSVITITFNIDGTGTQGIGLLSYLPTIRYPVYIDGYTQAGSSPNTNDFANGSNAVPTIRINANGYGGLEIEASNTTVRGLIINKQVGEAIKIVNSDSCIIEGNFLGTSVDGLSNVTPDGYGVRIENGSYNVIGGTSPGSRNVILGGVVITGDSSYNNTVAGNYIGTDKTGLTALSQNASGVDITSGAHNNVIGGTDTLARNLVSGNWMSGIGLSGNGVEQNKILNNYIGISANGQNAIPNNFDGVNISNGANNNVVGEAGAGNIISGNGETGIKLENCSGISIQGNHIGTNSSGIDLGNSGVGVLLFTNTSNNTIGGLSEGEGNTIAFNGNTGVVVAYGETKYNAILGNSIYQNNKFGIDFQWDEWPNENDLMDEDDGPNGMQNYPEIEYAREGDSLIVTGTFYSKPNKSYLLQFFINDSADASGYGEGQELIGSRNILLGADGQKDFSFSFAASNSVGKYITATATDDSNNTSEFSAAVLIRGQAAQISVSQESIYTEVIPNSSADIDFIISNPGVEQLNWSASWNESWLSLSSASGSVAPGGSDSLVLGISTMSLSEGTFYDTLVINSNDPVDSVIFIPVELNVKRTSTILEVSTDSFWVGVNSGDSVITGFYLNNPGSETVNWSVDAPVQPWMRIITESDTIGANQTDTVYISFNASGLQTGDYSNLVEVFSSDPNNADYSVKILMNVGDYPKLSVVTDTLNFELAPGETKTLPLVFENTGKLDLEWNVNWTFYSQWVRPQPTSGVTPVGGSSTVNVTVSANDLDSTFAEGLLLIHSNDPNVDEARVPVIAVIKDPTGLEDENKLPHEYSLVQNYPNPFNPSTMIKYSIPPGEANLASDVNVTLKVYDILGREVATLVNEVKSPGYYTVTFNARSAGGRLPSGIYLYKLTAGSFTDVKKMILMK